MHIISTDADNNQQYSVHRELKFNTTIGKSYNWINRIDMILLRLVETIRNSWFSQQRKCDAISTKLLPLLKTDSST